MEGDVDSEMIFSEGREVEVTSDEEGFEGAWFTATILEPPKNTTKDKALVQYKNLLDDDDQTPLTEHIKLSFIRPLPPQPKIPDDQCFEVNEVVDAFYLDGWWTGFVSKVFDYPKRYSVSFEHPPEEIEFFSSNLRPHWKWVDGKWVKPSNFQEVLISSDCQELVEVSCNNTKDAEATIQLESSDAVKCSNKKRKRSCVSSRKNEMGLSTACKGKAKGKRVKRAMPEGDATLLHSSQKLKDRSLAELLVLQESNMKDLQSGTPNIAVPAATIFPEKNVVGEQPAVKTSKTYVREEVEIHLQKEHDMSRFQKEDGAKTGIKRREQPCIVLKIKQPKLVFQMSQSPSAGQNDAAGVLEEMFSKEYTATEVESSAISQMEQAVERTAIVSATDSQRKEVEVTEKSGGILHDNEEQPPLICYKKMHSGLGKIHSVVMEENNTGHILHGCANQWNDPREKSLEIMVQSPLLGMTGDNEPEDEALPFVKSLPIWKAVQSMEIFQVIPQNPHFRPLVKLKEILREGVAVGHMLTFASLVQRTSNLRVADPRNLFTSILDALLDLEMLGFDVKAVRDRTSELLFMKDRHGHLQDQSKEVEVQVKQHAHELTKINEEIDINKKMLKELEGKQAILVSIKESKISKIASLQVCADVTTEDIQSVEFDFENLAATPW
ncbi:DUF724 domain-containing protein 6-like [Herrania umbratica]|uniref:DUF724 domain-containing protein 6-like n=1 Tax=Herrania umbratica TaxID=108875 RepID=A0A6J1AUG7_9ROSI|nr:DUF724 domain-containing protein 6-like [Herrania umbratica]